MIFSDNKHYKDLNTFTTLSKIQFIDNFQSQIGFIFNGTLMGGILSKAITTLLNYKKKDVIEKSIKQPIQSLDQIPFFNHDNLDSRFIDKKISNAIKKGIHKGCFKHTFDINIKNITLNVSTFSGSYIFTTIDNQRLFDFCHSIISFLSNYDTNPTTIINVFIFPTPYTKKYNTDCELPLTSRNINSGYTTHGVNKTIVIYRYEECFKVLLHELIHSLEMDFGSINEPNTSIRNMLNIDNHYNDNRLIINETYCEYWTIFIYTLFYSVERSLDIKNKYRRRHKIITTFIKRYTEEYVWNLINIYNIIQFHTCIYDYIKNMDIYLSCSLEMLFKLDNKKIKIAKMIVSRKLQETDTSLLEYTLIKTLMMTNIQLFFYSREKSGILINNDKSLSEVREITEFIKSCVENYSITKNKYNEIVYCLQSIDMGKLNTTLCMSSFH